MRLFCTNNVTKAACMAVTLLLMAAAAGTALGAPDSIAAVFSSQDKYEIRSGLLMQAMDYVGVCGAQEAAELWASGVMHRSGAMQYAALSKELKERYASSLEKSFPNWVTGVSSPYVSSYSIKKEDGGEGIYVITFMTATSGGPAGEYSAKAQIGLEDGFYRISRLEIPKELYAFTGFQG